MPGIGEHASMRASLHSHSALSPHNAALWSSRLPCDFLQATAGDVLRSGDTRVTAKAAAFVIVVVIVEVARRLCLLPEPGLLARVS